MVDNTVIGTFEELKSLSGVFFVYEIFDNAKTITVAKKVKGHFPKFVYFNVLITSSFSWSAGIIQYCTTDFIFNEDLNRGRLFLRKNKMLEALYG